MREQTFDTGNVVINYAEGPDSGLPLVLLHGGSASWRAWELMLAALTPGYHVYALDLRGHGGSGHVPGRYRVQDYADDLITFLERCVARPALVFGHSLGGIVAVMAAGQRPDLVAGLVAGDAPLSAEGWYAAISPAFERLRGWRDLAARRLPVQQLVEELKNSPVELPGQPHPVPARVALGEESPWFDWMALNMRQFDPGHLSIVLEDFATAAAGYSMERLLPRISAPVLLVQADPAHGAVLSDAEVARALQLLPQATHVRLHGLGHAFHAPSHTEPVLQAVLPFLDSLSAGLRAGR